MGSEMKLSVYKSDSCKEFSPVITSIGDNLSSASSNSNDELLVLPGFCDVHVHFREPGFSYKETIATGAKAAAHGGYTDVCTMPNLNPVPDSVPNLQVQLDIIEKDAVIGVHPYGSITVGQNGKELSDLSGMAPNVAGFSDDGRGVQDEEMMREAMLKSKELGKIISAHCEVNELLHGGYIHDGQYAKEHGHRGICSESEWKMIERDLKLAKETGCKYHVCHISCKESVDIIRKAKADGVDVTCETGPHYLIMTDMDLKEDGKYKMNPPLRSEADRAALMEGIKDGTIDMIATDHAPHSEEEKSRGLDKSAFGIVGIETAFPILYTHLVKTGEISFERLIDLLVVNPRKRFNLPVSNDDYTVWNLNERYSIDPNNFVSKGKAMPFEGMQVYGKCVLTVAKGKVAFQE